MNSAEIVRKLESEGWRKAHQAGSHIKFKHPDKPCSVTVPHPQKDHAAQHLSAGRMAVEVIMLYPVYVQVGDKKHAHGIEFPDFPGCFSAADDWQEINRMAQEAVECHMAGEKLPIPAPTALEKLAADPRYKGGVWMLVDLDLTRIDPAPKRVNISLPGSLLSQIDSYAQTQHLTRSGFLAKVAQEAMSGQ